MSKEVFDSMEELEEKEVKKNVKASKKQKALQQEYDETFSGEDKILHQLTNIKSTINVEAREIDIDDIVTSNFKKISRADSVTGLAGVVAEWGVISPVHVLALEDDDAYQLLDGLRRVFAALRSGQKKIQAMVWDFSDKTEGKEIANILSLMINRTQKYTPKEMWEQMKLLESVNEATPGLIEYLLQMDAGNAMKLKDVMLADNSYSEYREGLLFGKYTIEQAYKKLCNQRKKEDKLEKEDNMSLDQDGLKESNLNRMGSNTSDIDSDDEEPLGINEVKELLELGDLNKDVSEEDLEDLDKTNEIRREDLHQKVGERTYIDPNVKKATLARDGNKCRCCGIGGPQWLGILVYHHVIPVYLGGPDTMENGLTLCVNCHLTLHNYITGDIQVPELKTLPDDQQEIFKKIFHFGNIAIEAANKKGMKRDAMKKADAPSKKHPMPNQNVKMNKEALELGESLKDDDDTEE